MDIERQPFDLRNCVEGALDLVAARAAEKKLDLAYLFEGDVPPVVDGDVTRLRQVLLNLLANAVKFTPAGEVVLTVAPAGADTLRFTVRDTGIGLSEANLAKLFRSFSQADSSTTRRFGGTGLGLAISRRLAELMGGTMWAESPGPGLGASFHFTLRAPAAALPAVAPALLGAARIAAPATPCATSAIDPTLAKRHPLRILLAEDNLVNQKLALRLLGQMGYSADVVANGHEVLERVQERPYDVVLMDVQMPEMDGLEASRRLVAELEPHQRPRIVAMTANAMQGDREACLAAGMDGYVAKPIRVDALMAALLNVEQGAEQRA
jgi:CheY-like chemotaxis protein